MPEYLAPGVYVEETSYRSKSIEGVATSTAGFVGQSRFGPISGLPQLVTSFEEYQRYFGDDAGLLFADGPHTNHMAQAVRMFFINGGQRVYIARVFAQGGSTVDALTASGPAVALNTSAGNALWRARFPGLAGNVTITVQALRSGNLLVTQGATKTLSGVREGDVVEVSSTLRNRVVKRASDDASVIGDPLAAGSMIGAVSFDNHGQPVVTSAGGAIDLSLAANTVAQKLSLNVSVIPNGDGSTGTRVDQIQGLSPHPDSTNFVGRTLRTEDRVNGVDPPADRSNRVWLQLPILPLSAADRANFAATLLTALVDRSPHALANGGDGAVAAASDFEGGGAGDDATGMVALGEIDDIAIVAAPGSAALDDDDTRHAVRDALIAHCESLRYRFAVLAAQAEADTESVRAARAVHDSSYAALYYPWLVIPAPNGLPRETLALSPEGAIAGVYARTDIERGVHKAPANETVLGIVRFSRNVNKREQDVLNPEHINCLRFFEGRGLRVWGARTLSSDPDWTYVNVRRLFIYLEHSIDRGTQWAVFEPNNEQLWLKIRLTIESFLYDVWRTGALMGTKPEQAYFVRCDRTTMSQSDLDNGRLVCLIGVAPTKPAEFVIFRIGQWTADASII